MSSRPPPLRIVLLGTGTSVGKTWVACELLRELARRGLASLGLKPAESGVTPNATTDAERLAQLSAWAPADPPYRFPEAVSPHLAARLSGHPIVLDTLLTYVQLQESSSPPRALNAVVVETAGGLFSPLADALTNFDFARALDPAIWVLVAPDALGVIHDVTATLLASAARGRSPDLVVLSAAREPDASTGTNAAELQSLGLVPRPFSLSRDNPAQMGSLVDALLATAPSAPKR